MSEARLYAIPGSHPVPSVALMLDFKGLPFRQIDLLPVISRGILRLRGFPGVTVPALRIGGRKLQGSTAIARALDQIEPSPPLLPADPPERRAVLDTERIGEQELQRMMRQVLGWSLKRNGRYVSGYLKGSHTGVPVGIGGRLAGPLVAEQVRFNKASDRNVETAIASLPGLLDQFDRLIERGVIGGPVPNAADFQIAPSLALAMTFDDLRPAIEYRPVGHLAKKLVPDYPGHLPSVLPEPWLKPLGILSAP